MRENGLLFVMDHDMAPGHSIAPTVDDYNLDGPVMESMITGVDLFCPMMEKKREEDRMERRRRDQTLHATPKKELKRSGGEKTDKKPDNRSERAPREQKVVFATMDTGA